MKLMRSCGEISGVLIHFKICGCEKECNVCYGIQYLFIQTVSKSHHSKEVDDRAQQSKESGETSESTEKDPSMDNLEYSINHLKLSPEQYLSEVTFQGVADYIQSPRCKNILVMCGAGVSTAAGIPDFRTPGSGLYDNLQKYGLPSPQSIFKTCYFKENPEPFFRLAKESYPGMFKPTTTHYFMKLLEEKGLLQRVYTQNFDTLERIAGISEEKIVEAHGTLRTGHCLSCSAEYTQEWMREPIFRDEIPKCTAEGCSKGVVKPDIVFFGEPLPKLFYERRTEDFIKCDLLVVMGTSLKVGPFDSLVGMVPETTPRLLINREKVGDKFMQFDSEDNYRDVFWKGNCDDGCRALATLLGWLDELDNKVKSEHEKIDKDKAKPEI